MLTPFFARAQVDLMGKFNAETVWSKLLDESNEINLFIGVPTVFNQMIEHLNKGGTDCVRLKQVLGKKLRLVGSGSAPLNVKTYNEWFELTNFKILERYGMTEVGMALSNPLIETENCQRIAGQYESKF